MSNSYERSPYILLSLTLISSSFLISCSNFKASSALARRVDSAKSLARKSVAGILPSRVPIVEVNAKKLKKMPTGADRALAWDRQLDSKRYASISSPYMGNYKVPNLPDDRSLPTDGGILPPLHPGQGSALDGQGLLPSE